MMMNKKMMKKKVEEKSYDRSPNAPIVVVASE